MTDSTQRKMYFGPAEVTMVIELNQKTPSGGDVVKVCLDRKVQPYEIISKAAFEKLVSLEPVEDTLFQLKRYRPVLDKFAEILLEEGLIYADVPYVCKALHEKLSTAYERATNFLWTKDDTQFIPGVHELTNRSLLEADAIIKGISNESKNTGEEKGGAVSK